MTLRLLQVHETDNVAVAIADLDAGDTVACTAGRVVVLESIPRGHKVALSPLSPGDAVVKYGWPIGVATEAIERGQHVHMHNLRSQLTQDANVSYGALAPAVSVRDTSRSVAERSDEMWQGYVRGDGRAATRNELWVLPTVACVAKTAEALASAFRQRMSEFSNLDGVHAFGHPFGCSQLGDDLVNTQRVLAGLATHPNAGGVLVVGLGCENNHLEAFRPYLGSHDEARIRFLSAQASPDEHAEGLSLLAALAERASRAKRVPLPLSQLVFGLKCGGSDGLSGLTANPLIGRFTTHACSKGATALLTEVPEMFGAERALFGRCADREVFERAVELVQSFRSYYTRHQQPVHENPSPGNKSGGLSTLEEKSLGCVQKGGDATIVDVLSYGERVRKAGLSLLEAPGNDPVSTTALAASGATLVLFTTGRGTPLGSPVPTLKIASNSELAARKPGWIDFDAGVLSAGANADAVDREFVACVLATASGRLARNEQAGQRDVAIFKTGVTL